jgi:hypothetical protein
LWWARPIPVDMASFVPADALLYLEANDPSKVIEALAATDTGKILERMTQGPTTPKVDRFRTFLRWTGIGPIESVVLARSQVAAVVTDLGTKEEGDELRIKPEAAILIETHTTERRVRPLLERSLKSLAEKTYGHPTSRRNTFEGIEFVEWISQDGSRKMVAALVGSLVILGNSERTVQNCVAVTLGRRAALKDDPELKRMRSALEPQQALTFGFVPSEKSARLLAVGVPLLLGRAPADSDFQRLVEKGAANVFGSLGWTSRSYSTGIADRYLINLQPEVVARLKPGFSATKGESQLQKSIPRDVYSLTSYRFVNPVETWQGLKTAVSSQVDALSAIVFSSLLKSALLSYGIDEPESFLSATNGELLTARLDESSERSILIAGVRNREALHAFVNQHMHLMPGDPTGHVETFQDAQGEFAAAFVEESIVLGAPADVQRYIEARRSNTSLLDAGGMKRMNFFLPLQTGASIVTYTNDSDRVRSFITAVIEVRGGPTVIPRSIEETLAGMPYSVTETILLDSGIERTTRSPVGQFSTLLPLLVPDKPTPAVDGSPKSH